MFGSTQYRWGLHHGPQREATPAAERQADNEQRNRNVRGAEALLRFADTICRTVEAHPEWRDEARAKVKTAQAEADAAMRQAKDAARRAEEAGWLVQHLERTAADELYPAAGSPAPHDTDYIVWDITDPHVRDLMARSRTGEAL